MGIAKNSSWKTSFSNKAFKIVSIYLAISLLWIFSTDKLVFTFIPDAETQNLVSSIKGWFFVIVTTLLLYYLIQRALKEVSTAEQKLIESEIKFRSIFENSVDAISVSKEGKHHFVNDAHIALFGYSLNEIVGKPILDLIAPRHSEFVKDIVIRRAKGEVVPSSYETIGLKKDGSEFDMEVKVSSYYLNYDKYTLAIFRDITSRKKAEEALHESESYNRMLFNQSVMGLAVTSMDGKLIDISPAFANIIGRTIEETKQLSYWDITPQEYMAQEQQQLESLSTTGRYGPYEKEYIHKDGHRVPVRLQGLIIERNNEKFIWSSVEDITNHKKIEESLRDSEERFRTAFRTSPDAIILSRLDDGTYAEVNEGFTNLTGYTYKEVIGKSSLALNIWHNPEDRKRLVEGLKEDGRVNNLEALFVRKDGSCLTGLMSATILNIKGVPHILTITRDIDYIKKTQEALVNQEKHYRALFDLSPSGIVVADTDGIVIEVNDAYCKTIGYTHEELIGKNLELVVSDKDSEKVYKNKTEILNGKVLIHEVINIHRDGSHRNLELRETVVQLMNGQTGILSVSNDITERKRAFEELQKSRQEYRALSAHLQKIREDERAAIAREMHDELGQILTSLKMNIAFTRRELEASNSIEIKNKILTEFQLMNLTIDKAVSQVRKLITQLRPELLDKLGLIAALEWYSEEYQKNTKINCVFTSESEELFLTHDLELAIFRIVQEAMTNAAKHSEAQSLRVRLSKKEDNLIIEISDDGKGILGSDLEGSTSFGLMGMRERANLIGGILEIFGALGKGTTVRLSIKI